MMEQRGLRRLTGLITLHLERRLDLGCASSVIFEPCRAAHSVASSFCGVHLPSVQPESSRLPNISATARLEAGHRAADERCDLSMRPEGLARALICWIRLLRPRPVPPTGSVQLISFGRAAGAIGAARQAPLGPSA
jgi:hypothetical protein